MKCQILFSRKNKKNVSNLLSAESAHGGVIVNTENNSQSLNKNFSV